MSTTELIEIARIPLPYESDRFTHFIIRHDPAELTRFGRPNLCPYHTSFLKQNGEEMPWLSATSEEVARGYLEKRRLDKRNRK